MDVIGIAFLSATDLTLSVGFPLLMLFWVYLAIRSVAVYRFRMKAYAWAYDTSLLDLAASLGEFELACSELERRLNVLGTMPSYFHMLYARFWVWPLSKFLEATVDGNQPVPRDQENAGGW
jgi:hypothetical protein